jgi:hypothetical protein
MERRLRELIAPAYWHAVAMSATSHLADVGQVTSDQGSAEIVLVPRLAQTVPPDKVGTAAMGLANARGPSQIGLLERLLGRNIIAPRRSYSAHLHRPWRAIHNKTTNSYTIEIAI